MISLKAAGILAESLGNDLSKVANELDKLMLLLPGGGEIKENLVEEHTGISKEFNTVRTHGSHHTDGSPESETVS